MASTSIEWTDVTWNPVRGCEKVSPGCANCYAETFAERWRDVPGHPYEQGFDLRLVPDKIAEPLAWKKPRRVFVNSMSDLFQDGVPFDYIDQVFAVMGLATKHTFQVLTKRADRMREYVVSRAKPGWFTVQMHAILSNADSDQVTPKIAWPLPNVWLGCSVENQHFADERIPLLLQTPAAVRFISAEPLLQTVDLRQYIGLDGANHMEEFRERHGWGYDEWSGGFTGPNTHHDSTYAPEPGLHWVIVGGESGPGARPFDVAWARSIVSQCQAAGVPVFVKQLGAHVLDRNDAGFEGDKPGAWPLDTATDEWHEPPFQGDLLRIRLHRKGGAPEEWPRDLRIRQFPTVTT